MYTIEPISNVVALLPCSGSTLELHRKIIYSIDVEERSLCHGSLPSIQQSSSVDDLRLGMRPRDVYVGFVMLVSSS
jgi:hypothetical protein